MRSHVIALVYLSLLLCSPLAVAVPQDEYSSVPKLEENLPPIETAVPVQPSDTYTVISFQAATTSSPGVCRLSELTDIEIQRLKDSILTPGLTGSEISSGATPNADRDKISDRNTLLVPASDDETAFQKDIPTEILQPSELSTMQNQRIRGPIAFGISLDDSLRAARCVDENMCAVNGESLQYRNSGQGISGSVKDIFGAVQGDLAKPDSTLTGEDADFLRAQIESEQILGTEDANTLNVDTFSRVANPNLLNHIRADNTLQAGIMTNCDNGSCVVTLYSLFDKYFNSWFSGELVIGTFGPTLYGQFKKMIVNGKRFNLIKSDLLNKVPGFRSDKEISAIFDSTGKPIDPRSLFTRKTLAGKIEGDEYFRNLKKTHQRDIDLGDVYKEAFIDQKVTSGGGYPSLEDTLFGPTGKLTQLTDIDKRRMFFAYTGEIKSYADVVGEYNKQIEKLYKGVKVPDVTSPDYAVYLNNRTKAARGVASITKDTDEVINLDLRSTLKKTSESDFGGLVVSDDSTKLQRSMLEFDDKYFNEMMDSFAKKGDFSDVTLVETAIDPATGIRGIVQYEQKQNQFLGALDLSRIQGTTNPYPPGSYVEVFGRKVPATKDSLNELTTASSGAQLSVFSGITVPKVDAQGNKILFTPKNLTDKILAGNIVSGKIGTFSRNMGSMVDTMVARDFGGGPYTNLLSKSLQTKQNLISNYFKFYNIQDGGLRVTAEMYLYWGVTKAFGADDFSIYQLPEEWTEANFTPGEQDIYKDAYIDFFANEGSDTGDIFQKVISYNPFTWVVDEVASRFTPLENVWNRLNGVKARLTPENLAMFQFGTAACENCSAVVNAPSSGRFDIGYYTPESTSSFFLEHGKSKESQEDGQLLTIFAHHMNVDGKVNGKALDQLNLVNARNDGETCEQIMETLPVFGPVAKLIGAERTGAAIALTENLSYLGGGFFGQAMIGTTVSLINQAVIAPKMKECVDDKEGYFASLWVPNNSGEKTSKTDSVQKNVSTNALDGIRSFASQVKKDNPDPSLTDKVIQEATGKVEELVDEAQSLRVAEAELRVTGSSSGYLKSQEVIYFWVGGNSLIEPNRYNEEGKTVLATEDGHTITLDNETGIVSVDGQIVIEANEADHTRLANKNLDIPAVEIPQRLNGFTLPADNNALLLSINVRGETIVQDADLLDCIQSAVLAQSAVPLNSNNMTEAFGKAETVSTDAFPNIVMDVAKNRIIMGGQASQVASGPAASVQIYGDREVLVTGAPNPPAGKMQSVLLENGSVIYKPDTRELLIWLRHHAAAVVSDDEVKNFSGTLTTTTNASNSCEEPAINLAVETDPSTPGTKLKGDNLTAGLEKNGPFQVFETESKRFILYSKLVDGECKQFFKVIDKETGEVYDQAIDSITQSEDGTISIKTADGLSHSLKFSDENGKPVLTYDGKSEVLQSAVGKGGSFYYDPNKGLYYAENAQLIPLNDNFKNQGVGFQANPDGTASGKSGDNVFNINTGQGSEGLFNIPSLPESLAGLLAVVLLLGIICAGLYLDSRNRKKE